MAAELALLKQSWPNCRLALRLGHGKGAESRTMGIRQSAKLSTKYLTPFFHPMGSIAYTLALVAAGKADGTLNFDSRHEGDIAAGGLLVQEAGGIAMDSHKRRMPFNQPKTEVHGVIAARPGARESIEFLMNTVAIEEATKKQA